MPRRTKSGKPQQSRGSKRGKHTTVPLTLPKSLAKLVKKTRGGKK